MPRTQAQWIKLLRDDGWKQETGGKHQVKMTRQGRRPITLPDNHRRTYSKGFEAQLRREARLSGSTYTKTLAVRRQRDAGLER